MGSVKFDKAFLTEFDRSSKREFLETNSVGAYSSSTLAGVNTRKYHGTFVVRQPQNIIEKSRISDFILKTNGEKLPAL